MMWIRRERAVEAGRKAAAQAKNKLEFDVVYAVRGDEQGYVVRLYCTDTGSYLGALR